MATKNNNLSDYKNAAAEFEKALEYNYLDYAYYENAATSNYMVGNFAPPKNLSKDFRSRVFFSKYAQPFHLASPISIFFKNYCPMPSKDWVYLHQGFNFF